MDEAQLSVNSWLNGISELNLSLSLSFTAWQLKVFRQPTDGRRIEDTNLRNRRHSAAGLALNQITVTHSCLTDSCSESRGVGPMFLAEFARATTLCNLPFFALQFPWIQICLSFTGISPLSQKSFRFLRGLRGDFAAHSISPFSLSSPSASIHPLRTRLGILHASAFPASAPRSRISRAALHSPHRRIAPRPMPLLIAGRIVRSTSPTEQIEAHRSA
jgi:hypothetical protein